MKIGKKSNNPGYVFAPYIMNNKVDKMGKKINSKYLQTVASRFATFGEIENHKKRVKKIKKILKLLQES